MGTVRRRAEGRTPGWNGRRIEPHNSPALRVQGCRRADTTVGAPNTRHTSGRLIHEHNRTIRGETAANASKQRKTSATLMPAKGREDEFIDGLSRATAASIESCHDCDDR